MNGRPWLNCVFQISSVDHPTKSQDDYFFTAIFMQRIKTFKFKPSQMTAPYRTF